MKNYEAGTPSYFATRRSTCHCHSLGLRLTVGSASVSSRTTYLRAGDLSQDHHGGKISLEERLQMHREASVRFKTAMKDMGFKLVSRIQDSLSEGETY